MKYLRLLFLCVTVLGFVSATQASAQGFNPRSWFPLEVGSYWHRQALDYATMIDWVDKAVSDSVVDGETWTIVEQVYCSPSPTPWCPPIPSLWYRFTDDLYLLRAEEGSVEEPDTVWATRTRSPFAVASSDRLYWRVAGDSIDVTVESNPNGDPADSTDYRLSIYVPSYEIMSERYIYKIGRMRDLVGAVVSGVEYGDQSLISSVVLNRETESAPGMDILEIFPNPFVGTTTVSYTLPVLSPVCVSVFDLLGREVLRVEDSAQPAGPHELTVDGSGLRSGVYVLQVEARGARQSRTVVVL